MSNMNKEAVPKCMKCGSIMYIQDHLVLENRGVKVRKVQCSFCSFEYSIPDPYQYELRITGIRCPLNGFYILLCKNGLQTFFWTHISCGECAHYLNCETLHHYITL